jgi:hypothetical protein
MYLMAIWCTLFGTQIGVLGATVADVMNAGIVVSEDVPSLCMQKMSVGKWCEWRNNKSPNDLLPVRNIPLLGLRIG